MKTILGSLCAASLALSGCVAYPELPGGSRVNIADIIENIECDIKDSLRKNLPEHYWLLAWSTVITLKLDSKNKAGGSGDIGVSVPLVPETFGLTISTGPTKNAESMGSFTYSRRLIDIFDRTCEEQSLETSRNGLVGRTGAGDWMTRVARDAGQTLTCPKTMSYTLLFKITLDASGNPQISGIKIGDGTLSVGVKGSAQNIGEHHLTVVATPETTPQPPKFPYSEDEWKNYQKLLAGNEEFYRDVITTISTEAKKSVNKKLLAACGVEKAPQVSAATQRTLESANRDFLFQQLLSEESE